MAGFTTSPQARTPSSDRFCDLLITGGSVLTVDDGRHVYDPGAVAVVGDRIVAVGPAADLSHFRADRPIDASGMVVVPGFVDTHQHLFQYLLRGLGEGMELWPWLSGFMWPVSTTITSAEATIGAQLGAVEAIKSGVTTVLDNHYAPTDLDTVLAVAEGIEQVGLRGAVARGIFGRPTELAIKHGLAAELFRFSPEEELAITAEAIQRRKGTAVEIWPAPENAIYVDQQLIRDAVALARTEETSWHTHCSEAENDPVFYLDEYGVRPVDWLYQEGLLGPDATLAHGIYFDDQEVERLGGTQTAVAYCPISHQYIALGVMRLRDLRGAGVTVGLGLDGASGHRLDMFACMKQSILLQRVHTRQTTVSNAEEAVVMATKGGADYMRLQAGSLAPGLLADIAVVDVSGLHHSPLHRAVASLVYAASPADVAYTIVGGAVVYEDGRCTRVDEAAIIVEAQARAAELVSRAGLTGLLEPWRREPSLQGA